MNVTTKAFGTHSLVEDGLTSAKGHDIRVCTVHGAKRESIPAVLYVTNPQSLNSLLGDTVDEEGRIGYVAVTRAGDSLGLAIHGSTKPAKVEALKAKGLAECVG